MKIVFLTPKINLKGGGSNSNTDLRARALMEKGHDVKIITLFSKYNNLNNERPYITIEYNFRPKSWVKLNYNIYKILKKYEKEVDIYYIDGPQFLWGSGFYRMFGKKPVFMHFNVLPYSIYEHGSKMFAEYDSKENLFVKISRNFRSILHRYLDRFFAKKIDVITCTSPVIKEQCIEFGFNKKNLEILPEFIDTNLFFQANTRDNLAKPKKLLYVGRLVKNKGVDILINATRNLKQYDVSLKIVGDGTELKNLKDWVEAKKLEARVDFLGWIDRNNLKEIYENADIFVHPSRWAEPFGITIVEAMSAGIPVIVPEISGSAWVAGKAGLTFKNGNQKDLEEKIKLLIERTDIYNNLQKYTVSQAKKMDYRRWVDKFVNLIQKAKNNKRTENYSDFLASK